MENTSPNSEPLLSRTRAASRAMWIALAAVLFVGIFLRLPAALFEPGAALRFLAPLHPNPGFVHIGFDENLYRGYVNQLARTGLTSYPDLAENYVEVQTRLPSAILPPTRFLYVLCGYVWHSVTGADALQSLHNVSSLFSMLMLLLAAAFAWRAGGPVMGLSVAALMAFAPTQIHMGQHALIDGFFAFWATLCLWLLWENLRRPNDYRWLSALGVALALMVLTKENAAFAYLGLAGTVLLNRWMRFGEVTRLLLATAIVGPLLGVAILVNLCGGLDTTIRIYMLLVSKASVLPYAILTGDGPWYRYLVDMLLMSPVVLVLAIGGAFMLRRENKAAIYLLTFVVASYVLMCNVRYGMNLRYANMWDLPLRFLAVGCIANLLAPLRNRQQLWLGLAVAIVCAIELRQYHIFFVQNPLYELVTEGLLRALNILK
jgi:hypothetical protein